MLETKHFARLLYRFLAPKAFYLGLAIVAIAAASIRAGEPVMTLALADHQAPVKSTNNSPAAIHPDKESTAEVATEMRLEKSPGSGQADGLQLVHKSLSTSSRSNVSFSVQAGYGRIWGGQSMLQQISAGHPETGCAYVRANLSF